MAMKLKMRRKPSNQAKLNGLSGFNGLKNGEYDKFSSKCRWLYECV